jgi:hypothetical protein
MPSSASRNVFLGAVTLSSAIGNSAIFRTDDGLKMVVIFLDG